VSCSHVRLPHVVPGWGCCQCRAYNGYQRALCKNCGHMHCYDSGGLLGREARELAEIGGDAAKVFSWMEAKKDPRRGDA